jgi:hypothetical protein
VGWGWGCGGRGGGARLGHGNRGVGTRLRVRAGRFSPACSPALVLVRATRLELLVPPPLPLPPLQNFKKFEDGGGHVTPQEAQRILQAGPEV